MTEFMLEVRIEELVYLPPYTNILVKILSTSSTNDVVYCLQDKIVVPIESIFIEDYKTLDSYVLDDEFFYYETSGVYSNRLDETEIELNPKFGLNGKYFLFNKTNDQTVVERTAKRKVTTIDINLYQGKIFTVPFEVFEMGVNKDDVSSYTIIGFINGFEVILDFDIST